MQYVSVTVLAGLLLAVLSALFFGWIAEEMLENDTARFDDRVRTAVHLRAHPALTQTMKVISDAGSPISVCVLTFGGFAIFWHRGRRRDAVVLGTAILGASIVDLALKLSFHRVRPVPFFNVPVPLSFSFPSGHSMIAFCFYVVLAHLLGARIASFGKRLSVWAGAVAMFLLIGLSRIYLGVHFPSDVIAGYAAGSVWIATVLTAERFLKHRAGPGTPPHERRDWTS